MVNRKKEERKKTKIYVAQGLRWSSSGVTLFALSSPDVYLSNQKLKISVQHKILKCFFCPTKHEFPFFTFQSDMVLLDPLNYLVTRSNNVKSTRCNS